MNAHPHRYAGYRSPIPNAHIARALGDVDDVLREAVKADNLRDGVPLEERQADNTRRFYRAHPRFDGPPVHETIGGCPRWLDTAAKAVIIAGLIVSLAIWIAA
jgi:hypothetical protein